MVKYTKRRKIGGNMKSFSGIVCGQENNEENIAEFGDRVSCEGTNFPVKKGETDKQVTCYGNKIVIQKCKNIDNGSTRDFIEEPDCNEDEYLANVCGVKKSIIKCPIGQERVVKCINNEGDIRYPENSGKCPTNYYKFYDCRELSGIQRSTAKIPHNTPIDVYSKRYEQLTGNQSPFNSTPNSPLNSAINSPRSSFASVSSQGGKRRRSRKNKRRGRKTRKHSRRK
jgi:hypothetical protein